MAGFEGAIKNVGIGMSSASSKVLVHTAGTRTSGSIFYNDQDAWLEALPEMVSAVRDHVGSDHIVYISVMNRLSAGYCFSSLHVWDDPYSNLFFQAGHEARLACSFHDGSILLNPQLIIYSAALGPLALTVRILSCFLSGCAAGLLLWFFYRDRQFFNFDGFEEKVNRDTDPNFFLRYIKNLWRNVKATGLYFLFGILLSALFQRYMPQDFMVRAFGGNEAWGVLMAATIGVPLYACDGGTSPLLKEWLWEGMSMGSAVAFMLTGPSTKITNLGALKIVLCVKHFLLYLAFVMLFSFSTGLLVNLFIG